MFFGRGEWMEKGLNYLAAPPAFAVDNNRYEQGQEEAGFAIYHPDKLTEEPSGSLFILITTTGFPDVGKQLQELGFKAGEDYCVSPSLKNFQVVARINGHDNQAYLTCSDRPDESEDRGGGLYRYDLMTRQNTKVINGLCHGIVQSGDRVFLVDDLVGIRLLDREMNTSRIFGLPPKSRPHGISYCPVRNLVFVSFSGRDSVGVYDADTGELVDELCLSLKFKRHSVAQHHVNDCCVFDGSLYVSMFSLTGNWKIGMYDGGVLEFDIDSKELIGSVASNLWMPHTPVVINGKLYYCDSMRGIVSDTSWDVTTQFNGFVRGIAYDGCFFYIGQSTHRYIDRREGTTNNVSLDTGLFLVDPVHKATRFFATPELSDINNVMVLS